MNQKGVILFQRVSKALSDNGMENAIVEDGGKRVIVQKIPIGIAITVTTPITRITVFYTLSNDGEILKATTERGQGGSDPEKVDERTTEELSTLLSYIESRPMSPMPCVG